MKRLVSAALALALVAVMAPSQSSAQVSIALSVGPTFPMGDFGEFAKLGFIGIGGVTVPVGASGLVVGAHGFYGSNSHEDEGDKTNLLGALGSVGFAFPTSGSMMPYIFGGLGLLKHSYKSEDFPEFEGSESGLAFGGGAGVGFTLGVIQGSLDAFYLMGSGDVDGTDLFGVTFGIGFPLGGGAM
jgi:hypothetical protein